MGAPKILKLNQQGRRISATYENPFTWSHATTYGKKELSALGCIS